MDDPKSATAQRRKLNARNSLGEGWGLLLVVF